MVDAHREGIKQANLAKLTSNAQYEKQELENIYADLQEYDYAYDPKALVEDVRRRIYNLLY